MIFEEGVLLPKWTWPNSSVNLSVLLSEELHHDYSRPLYEINSTLPQHVHQARSSQRPANINCQALFNNDFDEMYQANQYMRNHQPDTITDAEYINMTRDCANFRWSRGYIMKPLSRKELETPLAFSIITYKNVFQTEKLLRAIYMPQNFYCVHLDIKANESTQLAMHSIAECFPNVFIASRFVHWGHISIIYAELNCLSDLVQYSWKYFLNLSAQMFPLHSNRELVQILNMYDGANDIEGTQDRSVNRKLSILNKII